MSLVTRLWGQRSPISVSAARFFPAGLIGALALLLLVAGLLALGVASRRPAWQWADRRRGLSALTRRYLDRAGGRR